MVDSITTGELLCLSPDRNGEVIVLTVEAWWRGAGVGGFGEAFDAGPTMSRVLREVVPGVPPAGGGGARPDGGFNYHGRPALRVAGSGWGGVLSVEGEKVGGAVVWQTTHQIACGPALPRVREKLMNITLCRK